MRPLIAIVAVLALAIGLTPAAALSDHPADAATTVLVHVAADADLDAGVAAARRLHLTVGGRYPQIGVFAAAGTARALDVLAASPAVAYLEPNAVLQYDTETSHTATRGAAVLDGAVTLPDGTTVDGAGVGVAVVDSGIDATHPDLAERVVRNLRWHCAQATGLLPPLVCDPVELPDTDTPGASGHGTHVAGTVAGTGQASDGRWHGAAPGASLYGLGNGLVLLVTNALETLQWVLDNHDQVDPPIKVVNNSWGSGPGKPNPDNPPAITLMQEALIDAGLTLVFSAGNRGGNGSTQQTSIQCVYQKPGNVCVANYNDHGAGTRDGSLSSTSSRGQANDPETGPDLSAPGSGITATCRLTLPLCWLGADHEVDPPNSYAAMSGTSMAAPHVAGIAALLYQADPDLAPGEVEWVLKETAHKFTYGASYQPDPAHPGGLSSFDKGHGLVDALAAVEAVLDPLVVSAPADGAAVGREVTVSGRIWYGDTVQIAVDGQPAATLETNRSWSHTLTGLAAGERTVTVTLSSAGRVVAAVERTVTVS